MNSLMYALATGTSPPVPMPCRNRNTIMEPALQANRHRMSIDTNSPMVISNVFSLPIFSAIQPNATAPTSWPR